MFSKLFALLFTISISIFLFIWLNSSEPVKKEHSTRYEKPHLSIEAESIIDIFDDSKFVMMASLSTSIFSFLGFLLSLRSSRKENEIFDLQITKLKAEIENLGK